MPIQNHNNITRSPKAFQHLAKSHNALSSQVNGIEPGYGIAISKSQSNTKISLIPSAVADIVGQVIQGGSLPDGFTFRQFTVCDSGNAVNYWWPTWDTDPS